MRRKARDAFPSTGLVQCDARSAELQGRRHWQRHRLVGRRGAAADLCSTLCAPMQMLHIVRKRWQINGLGCNLAVALMMQQGRAARRPSCRSGDLHAAPIRRAVGATPPVY